MEEKDKIQYVNAASLSFSPYEVRMELYMESPGEQDGTVDKEKVADIRLSPVLAKDLSGIIGNCMKDYESSYGEIPTKREE